MKIPTIKEVLAKNIKDWTPIDKFVYDWVGDSRKMRNALQRVVDYAENLN